MEFKQRIETKRLYLRPFAVDDASSFFTFFSDAETMKYSFSGPLTFEQTTQQIQEYIEEYNKHQFGVYVLVLKETGGVIGYCGLEWHWLEEKWQPELVYCLSKKFWNKGLAFEAARTVLKHANGQLKIPVIVSLIRYGNDASIRLAEKMGARMAGEVTIHGIKKLKYVYPEKEGNHD
jgi:RimJ/RimL family protein N-acetyltransferase